MYSGRFSDAIRQRAATWLDTSDTRGGNEATFRLLELDLCCMYKPEMSLDVIANR